MLKSVIKASLKYFSPQSAYEDKQHSKRKEISSRPWFSTSLVTPGSAAGSLLHKLSLQGKEAAMAKTLNSSYSPLIRVKTEPCATVSRTQSLPENGTCGAQTLDVTRKEEAPRSSHTQLGREAAETLIKTEDVDDGQTEATEQNRSLGHITSLVADYSDSDSDPGP